MGNGARTHTYLKPKLFDLAHKSRRGFVFGLISTLRYVMLQANQQANKIGYKHNFFFLFH